MHDGISIKNKRTLTLDFGDHIVNVVKQGKVDRKLYYSWSTMGATECGPEYSSELLTENEVITRLELITDSNLDSLSSEEYLAVSLLLGKGANVSLSNL